MRKYRVLAFACCLLLCALPASASVLDISGTWILDFPQGQGLIVLQATEDSPPGYQGQLTIPCPSRANGKFTFEVKMVTDSCSVVTGEDIRFKPFVEPADPFGSNQSQHMKDEMMVSLLPSFNMNLGTEESGLAWITQLGLSTTSGPDIQQLEDVKVPVHR